VTSCDTEGKHSGNAVGFHINLSPSPANRHSATDPYSLSPHPWDMWQPSCGSLLPHPWSSS